MKVLAVGAHPDDIEYGCGGSLLRLKKVHDAEIHFFVATCGSAGGDAGERKREQELAGEVLGVKKVHWGGFEDTKLTMGGELISAVEKCIDEVQPDIVFVNSPKDTHQDHKNLGEATIIAARYCQRVLFYEDFTARGFDPTFYRDIGDVLLEKVALLRCHHSQVNRQYPTGLDILESVKAVANYRGFQAKCKYAEGFEALRYLLDDIE